MPAANQPLPKVVISKKNTSKSLFDHEFAHNSTSPRSKNTTIKTEIIAKNRKEKLKILPGIYVDFSFNLKSAFG